MVPRYIRFTGFKIPMTFANVYQEDQIYINAFFDRILCHGSHFLHSHNFLYRAWLNHKYGYFIILKANSLNVVKWLS